MVLLSLWPPAASEVVWYREVVPEIDGTVGLLLIRSKRARRVSGSMGASFAAGWDAGMSEQLRVQEMPVVDGNKLVTRTIDLANVPSGMAAVRFI